MHVNTHQLELFYYVARHGGISQACRKIPYGIGQPAISTQMRELEQTSGFQYFKRWPFELTPQGLVVYEILRPLFEKIPAVIAAQRGPESRRVTIASSPLVCRDYLPAIIKAVLRRFPDANFHFLEGQQPQIEDWLASREADLAITVRDGPLPEGCRHRPLLEMPLVLLAPATLKARSAADLWRGGTLRHRLLTPPPQDFITRALLALLARRSITVKNTMSLNSIELIETYVKDGFGVGVSAVIPGRSFPEGVRAFALPGFRKLKVGALWHGTLNLVGRALLEEVAARVAQLSRPALPRRIHPA